MSQEFAVNEAQELRQQFLAWRRRFLFWKAFYLLGVFLCCSLFTALMIFVIDYAVVLPRSLRIAILCIVVSVTVALTGRVLRFLYHPPKFAALARSIQTRHTDERSSLIAAGMLLDESSDISERDGATAAALRYARQHTQNWNWQASIDRTKPLSWLVAIFLLAVVSTFLWKRGPRDLISQRWLSLLSNQSANESTLVFLDPPSSTIAGHSIRLHIKHSELVKRESIRLEIQGVFGDASRVQSTTANVATFQISNIQSPLRVQARAGVFARSGYLDIALRDRLKVLAHEFVITPPSYLEQSAYRSNKSDLSVPRRSRVELKVSLSEPTDDLMLQAIVSTEPEVSFEGRANQASVAFDLSSLTDLNSFNKNSNRAAGNIRYRLELLTKQDGRNLVDLDYDLNLQVQADAPPGFAIFNPPLNKSSLTLSEVGEQFKAAVTDDYGIESIDLVIRDASASASAASGDQSSLQTRHLFQRDQGSKETSMVRSFTVDEPIKHEDMIAKWPTSSAIDCFLVATDIAGQQSISTKVQLLLHEKDSQLSQAVEAIGSVMQMQQQLQKQTEQAAHMPQVSPGTPEQLASQQQAIRSKWQEANKPEQNKSSKQEKSVNSIDQLMKASENTLKDGHLIESSSIQSGILHRLKELASDLQSDANSDRTTDAAKSLENQISNWSQQQSRVSELVKDGLDKAADSHSLQTAQADESKLQKEIQQQLDALEESSPFAWPLSQANKSIARANAKLQRDMVDASTLADAQNAADMLKSLADNIGNESQSSSHSSSQEENVEGQGDPSVSSTIQELEIIQSLQSRLHDRLLSIQAGQASSNESTLATVRSIAQSQSELAQRTKKLSQTMSEK